MSSISEHSDRSAAVTGTGGCLGRDFRPFPSELKDLVAQLVALEAGMRGSTERSIEVLRPAIARHGAVVIDRALIGPETGVGQSS